MSNWWKNHDDTEQVVDWAYEALDDYGDHHMISLGQSAAWIVHTAGMIRKHRGGQANVTYIPFSNNFLKDKSCKELLPDFEDAICKKGLCFEISDELQPSEDAKSKYFSYLSSIGASPEDIVNRYKETGQKTVMLEMIDSGKGFVSFCNLWFEESRKKFSDKEMVEAMQFHIYDQRSRGVDPLLHIKEGGVMMFPGEDYFRHELDQGHKEIMWKISSDNDLRVDSCRLVPMYSFLSGDNKKEGILLCPNEVKRKNISLHLHEAVQSKEQARYRLSKNNSPSV